MKKLSMLSVIMAGALLGGCGSDDKEFKLDPSRLTGVDWYYNGGTGNDRLSFSDSKVLEITRFDKSGELKGMDLRGQVDSVAATWQEEGINTLRVDWKAGGSDVWTVLKCNSSTLKVNNGWGDREYTSKPTYLEDLTGDVFWMNYFEETAFKTRLGFRVSGNKNLRPGYVHALLADDKSGQVELENYGDILEGEAESAVEARKVRFSCRIGSKNYVKFDEHIPADNFEPMSIDDIQMEKTTVAGEEKKLKLTWNKFAGDNVYYKIEVYSAKKGEADLYFDSGLFTYESNYILSETTKGNLNRLDELDAKGDYVIRLTAAMLEPGVFVQDLFAEDCVQAVVYVTTGFSWK